MDSFELFDRLDRALKAGDNARMRSLLDQGRELLDDALGEAASRGEARLAKILLGAGARPEGKPGAIATPLAMAASCGRLEVAELLLEKLGAAGPKGMAWGVSAFHLACSESTPEMVRTLLLHGADPGSLSRDGYTPLMFAAQRRDGESARDLARILAPRMDLALLRARAQGETAADIARQSANFEAADVIESAIACRADERLLERAARRAPSRRRGSL